MSSSILAAMSRLKVESTTWASLPNIPSTDKKKRDFSQLLAEVMLMLVLLYSPLPRQTHIHYLFLMGLCIRISESDVNDGFCLSLLLALINTPPHFSGMLPPQHTLPLICCRPGGLGAHRIRS